MDSKTLFVLHNGQMRKVATCKARPWVEDTDNEETDIDTESDNTDSEEEV